MGERMRFDSGRGAWQDPGLGDQQRRQTHQQKHAQHLNHGDAPQIGGLILRGGELTLALNTGYVFANVPNAIDMRDIDGIRKWFTASLTGMSGLLDILRKSPALTDTVS